MEGIDYARILKIQSILGDAAFERVYDLDRKTFTGLVGTLIGEYCDKKDEDPREMVITLAARVFKVEKTVDDFRKRAESCI